MGPISCDVCAYWVPLEHGSVGECRRRAPMLVSTFASVEALFNGSDDIREHAAVWPRTYEGDWCGDAVRDPRRAA